MWLVVLVEQPQQVLPFFVSPSVNSVFLYRIQRVFLRGLASVEKTIHYHFFSLSGKYIPII